MCTAVHPKGTGHLLSDVRQLRRIQENAREREYTDEERRLIDGMTEGNHAPELQDDAPLPMLAVAQLYARDIPDLVGPEDHDLLQVFWCPFEVHGADRTIEVVLKWRPSADVGAVLTPQPEPPVAGRAECVPTMCVMHPEHVVEHEYLGLLDEELQEEIDEWEEGLLDEEDEVEPLSSASYATYEEYAEAMAVARAAEPPRRSTT
ncbi:hypothetical protein [Streptomyces sp. NPDC060322]|uniref:hypothetical protein n=1 Tax=Streptomyces sp. NPDC060322 TaxID=3347097 RepID=UPI003660C72E